MLNVGDNVQIKVKVLENGCYYVANDEDSDTQTIEATVVSRDGTIVEVAYFCKQCSRNVVTAILDEEE
jgi:ethanolamine utilization microcompartment shell protein EutL